MAAHHVWIDERGDTYPLYGSGYFLRPGARNFTGVPILPGYPNAYVEFRRAYILVSDKEWGTLVIRNSSPDFGRDSMSETAYYSSRGIGEGFSLKNLQDFNQAFLERYFTHVLDPEINFKTGVPRNIRQLITAVRQTIRAYNAWKFDTNYDSAWVDPLGAGKKSFIGGELSPGFPAVVKLLRHDYNRSLDDPLYPVPRLCFAREDLPAWGYYPFHGPDGRLKQGLIVNDEVLEVLEAVVASRASDQELDRVGLLNFFRKGVEEQVGLTLID